MEKMYPVFHPQTAQYRGLWSKPAIVTLQPGMFNTVKNWRIDDGVLRVRFPMTRSGTDAGATAVTGNFAGAWTGFINGVRKMVCVNVVDGSISEFSGIADGVRTALSAGSGKYGSTHLDTSFQTISFAVGKDTRSGKEYLVIQDGKSYARVWDPSETDTGEKIAINQPITLTTTTPAANSVLSMPKFVDVQDHTAVSYTNSHGTRFTAADGGTDPNNYISFAITTAATVNDTSQWTFSSIDFSACKDLYIYCKLGTAPNAYRSFVNQVKLELVDSGAGNTTLWDPSTASTSTTLERPLVIPIGTDGVSFLLKFPLGHVPTTSRDTVTGLLWTFKGTAPSVNQTLLFYCIMGSGLVMGQCAHALSLFNQGSRGESAGIWFDAQNTVGEFFRNLGGASTLTTTLPNDPRLFYRYNLNYINPTTAQMQAGVDAVNVYRADPNIDGDYSRRGWVKTRAIAAYSGGSWAFSADEAGVSGTTNGLQTVYDNEEAVDYNVLAPDLDCLSIPKGIWMHSTPERLFVCAYESTASYQAPAFSRLWASDVFNFSRFYRYHKTEDSGTSVALQGEIAICLKTMPTSVYGVSTMLMWTNEGVYRFSPTSSSAINALERIGPYGTWCPYSVAASKDALFWVDQSRVVRRYGYNGIEDLSSQSVQDKLDVAGGSTWALAGLSNSQLFFGGFWNERYYLSFDRDGTYSWANNNEQPMVYDTREWYGGEIGWLEDELGSSSYSTRFWLPAQTNLYTLSKDGFLYKYEDPAGVVGSGIVTDGYQYATGGVAVAGAGYTATLKSGALFALDGRGFVIRHSDAMCDDVASNVATYTYTYLPSGSAPTQTAVLDGSGSVTYACTTTPPSDVAEGRGIAASHQIVVASGAAGMRLYGLRFRFDESEYRPNANA